jgi:hypothetical protein
MIEQRVEEVTDYAKQVTQTAAVIAALCAAGRLTQQSNDTTIRVPR